MKSKRMDLDRTAIAAIIIAAMAGTSFMTLFVNKVLQTRHPKLELTKILGTMLTNETRNKGQLASTPEVFIVGNVCHYIVGIGFALIYLFLWINRIGKPNLVTSFILGFLSGVIGIIVWHLFFTFHPNAPRVPLKKYLLTVLMGHVVFAINTTITFKILISDTFIQSNNFTFPTPVDANITP